MSKACPPAGVELEPELSADGIADSVGLELAGGIPDAVELELAGGGVELWVAEPARGEESLEQALSSLSAEERARCERAIDPAGRERRILARASLRAILGRRLGVSPLEVLLSRDARGRPLLGRTGPAPSRAMSARERTTAAPEREGTAEERAMAAQGLSLSVSYGGSWIAVALGEGVSVGVDIEPRDRRVSGGVIARALHPREREAVAALEESHRGEAFLCYWTLKEACGKALGTGLGGNLERLEMEGVVAGEPRLLDPELAGIAVRRWDPLRGLIGAVAARPTPRLNGS